MNKKSLLLTVLSVLAVSSLASCGNTTGSEAYTYRDAVQAGPDTWNAHTRETTTDAIIRGYTEMGFYDFVLNDTKDGYNIVCEMASALPEDVTNTLTDEEVSKYGLNVSTTGEKYTEGQKWVINLNEAACWEDGTPINADTYIESMDRLLDSSMANSRASGYYEGNLALGNAEGRFKSGRTTYEPVYTSEGEVNTPSGTKTSDDYYGSIYEEIPYVGYSMYDIAVSYGLSEKGAALAKDTDTWGTSSDPKRVNLSESESLYNAWSEAWCECLTNGFGISSPSQYVITTLYQAYASPEVDFSSVGIEKTGEYQITLYLLNPTSLFYMEYNLSSNWIVNTTLYDEYKTTVGTLVSTTYGTSLETYMGYGPYKLTSYVLDKEILLERNENWYGWKDGKHEGEFQTTNIEIQVVPSEDTILSMFELGEIDGYSLRSEDVAKYGMSSRILYTPQTYTDKVALNSDFAKLYERQVETGVENKTMLSNLNFRKGLSWGLDRLTFVQTQTAGSAAATYFINYMYVCDPNTGLAYRNIDAAKKVVTDFFGDNENGYDLDKAREYITKACEEENASTRTGSWKTGQKVVLEWGVYNEGWSDAIQFVADGWTEMVKGTPLEGLLEIKLTYDTEFGDKLAAGNYEIGMDIWGGAQMDPYSMPNTWIYTEYKAAYGFNPSTESFTLNIDGEDITMTNTEWYYALNNGDYSSANASVETRVQILAGLESYILENVYYIPQRARQSLSMNSYKVEYGTNDYVQLVGFGGIRKMTYNYNDANWASYAANGLDYTK